jgi:hypothetical protein
MPHFSGPDYKETLDLFGIHTQPRLGFSAGAFASLGLFDLLAVQPEAYHAFLGGRYGDDTGSFVEDPPVFQIPLLVKGRVESGGLVITLLAGSRPPRPGPLAPPGRAADRGQARAERRGHRARAATDRC